MTYFCSSGKNCMISADQLSCNNEHILAGYFRICYHYNYYTVDNALIGRIISV